METLGQNLIGWIQERMGVVELGIAFVDNFWSFAIKAKIGICGYWEICGHGIIFPYDGKYCSMFAYSLK